MAREAPMSARFLAACLLWAAFLGGGPSQADETADEVVVTLTDGGRLVGVIVREDEATLTLRTTSGLELQLARSAIDSVGPAAPSAPPDSPAAPVSPEPALNGFSDPNDTRLMFAPTGRPLGKGDGY